MNKLEICKRASILAGENPIQSLTGTDIITVTCNNMYDGILDRILSEGYWDFAIKQKELNKDTEVGEFDLKNIFILPSDFIRLIRFLHNDNIELPEDFRIIGNKLYTNNDRVAIEYTSRVDESLLPFYLTQAISYELASEISYSLTEDKSKAQELSGKAEYLISKAKKLDNSHRPAQKVWNSSYLNARWRY